MSPKTKVAIAKLTSRSRTMGLMSAAPAIATAMAARKAARNGQPSFAVRIAEV
jgi:hypothetical protein